MDSIVAMGLVMIVCTDMRVKSLPSATARRTTSVSVMMPTRSWFFSTSRELIFSSRMRVAASLTDASQLMLFKSVWVISASVDMIRSFRLDPTNHRVISSIAHSTSLSKTQRALNNHNSLTTDFDTLDLIIVGLDLNKDSRRPIQFVALLGNNLRYRPHLYDPVVNEIRAEGAAGASGRGIFQHTDRRGKHACMDGGHLFDRNRRENHDAFRAMPLAQFVDL